jgi:hypothetical protein
LSRSKLFVLALAVAVGIGAIISGVVIRSAGADTPVTTLTSFQEVPANVTPGFGELQLTINDTTQTITFRMRWSSLAGGSATQAHIHIGQPGVNGGISAYLCGGSTKPACPAGASASIANGTIVPADVIGPSGQGVNAGDWNKLVQAIRGGKAYANIHNQTWPGGEIRGQISLS